MKRLILTLFCASSLLLARAGDGDEFFHVSAGYLYNNTLNASIGWEHEFN